MEENLKVILELDEIQLLIDQADEVIRSDTLDYRDWIRYRNIVNLIKRRIKYVDRLIHQKVYIDIDVYNILVKLGEMHE